MRSDSKTDVERTSVASATHRSQPDLPPEAAVSGTILARYDVQARVGVGGTSVVYRAHDRELDRPVAVKLLKLDEVEHDALIEDMARLLREGQVLARLNHPNIVEVFDAGRYRAGDLEGEIVDEVPKGGIFIVEELIVGRTLSRWRRASKRAWREVVDVSIQAGRALEAAHEHGLVHRDFKPSNVMVGCGGRVRVLDFGLAALVEPETEGDVDSRPEPLDGVVSMSLTRTGTVMGTPLYMAPEQHEGAPTDERSDQYSFCATLFTVLFAERPFRGETMADLYRSKYARAMVWPKRIPARLRRAIERGLSPRRDDRFPSMSALLGELEAIRRGRSPLMVASGVFGAGLLATVTSFVTSAGGCESGDDRLSLVWGQSVRAEIQRALLETGVPYAADAWEGVEPRLDGFAADWESAHGKVCRAGPDDARVLDERMACLDQRLIEFEQLIALLAKADAVVVEKSVVATARLPSAQGCLDADEAQSEPALPQALAADVQAAREDLQRVEALLNLGRWKEAETLGRAVLERALELGYPPLEPEARVQLAAVYIELEDFDAVFEQASQAAWQAESLKHDRAAALGQVYVVGVLGIGLRRGEEALKWARTAEASLRRSPDVRTEARLHYWVGLTLTYLARFEEAFERLETAKAILAREPDPIFEASIDAAIGAALEQLGELDRAKAKLYRAVDTVVEHQGQHHPNVSGTRKLLASTLMNAGEPEAAERELRISLAIDERTKGPNGYITAVGLDHLGNALAHQGRYADARPYHERANAILRQTVGSEHHTYVVNLMNLASDYLSTRRHQQARTRYLEAIELLEARSHPYLAFALHGLGNVLCETDRCEEGVVVQTRALALAREVHGPEHPNTMNVANSLAIAKESTGDCEGAIELSSQALNGLEQAGGPREYQLISPLTLLGVCHLTLENTPAAVAHLERAALIADQSGDPFRVFSAHFHLAKALWGDRRRRSALRHARAARRALRRNPDLDPNKLAEVEAWLEDRGAA